MRTKKAPRFSLPLRRIFNAAATLVKQNLSWSIFLTSLLWFLLRTGTKPSRALYPCQQAAGTNIFVFGLSTIAPFWFKLKKCRRFPLKVLGVSFLTLFLITGALGFTRTKAAWISWFCRFNGLPKEARVLASTTGSRVVWVHDERATNWDYGSDYYGHYVDQNVVNNMVDQGVMALTGTSSVPAAWRRLVPNYEPGKAIAIKVNFNCADGCNDTHLRIDALVHPVNGIVRGLKQIGVAEEDIWVYDATRPIPNRFVNGCLYSGVQYFAERCRRPVTYNSDDPDAIVHLSHHSNQKIPDVLVNATYLINIPIMKRHGDGDDFGVTLSFKNHYGTIQRPGDLHNNRQSALFDLNSNPHIRDKTRLVVGDGLFGCFEGNWYKPERWASFNDDAPNSLFFSTDPVAIDSVMYDFLMEETGYIADEADDHLARAEAAGMGVFEHGDPWRGSDGYTRIDFIRCEDSVCPRWFIYLPFLMKSYTL